MSDDPKRIVEEGYNAIAERFAAWQLGVKGSPDEDWLAELLDRLPGKADVLELGCGQGVTARCLVDAGHRYVGVDLSEEQLRRARSLVPDAEFRHGDLMELHVEAASLDAAVSLYVLSHLKRAEVADLLPRVASWLRPGGYLLATFGTSGTEGVQDDWLGVPMFFGSHSEQETLRLLTAAAFAIERAEVVSIVEPEERAASFLWVLARR